MTHISEPKHLLRPNDEQLLVTKQIHKRIEPQQAKTDVCVYLLFGTGQITPYSHQKVLRKKGGEQRDTPQTSFGFWGCIPMLAALLFYKRLLGVGRGGFVFCSVYFRLRLQAAGPLSLGAR